MAKKVLIVEDSLVAAEMLKETLKDIGCEVTVAANGQEGLEKIQSNDFDVAILDTVLPDTDGFEVCKKIKQIKQDIVAIMTTGQIDALDALKARKSGADDYAVKTEDFIHLVDVIKKYL